MREIIDMIFEMLHDLGLLQVTLLVFTFLWFQQQTKSFPGLSDFTATWSRYVMFCQYKQ